MSIIPCSICHGFCTGHAGTGWNYPVSTASGFTRVEVVRRDLSDEDIERIAKRVAELLKGQTGG